MSNTITSKKTNRILFLDLIKFLSISYIFIYHFICDVDTLHSMIDLSFITNLCLKPNFNMGVIATNLFVIISGATLAMSQDKSKFDFNAKSIINFYKKRIMRILIPYYIVYIIFYIYLALYNHVIRLFTNLNPVDYIWNIFAMDGYASIWGYQTAYLNVGEWFLGCIIICYVFFPLLYFLNKKIKYITFIILTAIEVYILYTNQFTPNFNLSAYYQIYNFYMGIFLSDLLLVKKIDFKFHIIFIAGIIYAYMATTVLPLMLLIQTIICVFIYIIFYHTEKVLQNDNMTSFLTKFSTISYEFFLVHHFVISQADYIINKESITITEATHIFFTDLLWIICLSMIFHSLVKLTMKIYNRKNT